MKARLDHSKNARIFEPKTSALIVRGVSNRKPENGKDTYQNHKKIMIITQ